MLSNSFAKGYDLRIHAEDLHWPLIVFVALLGSFGLVMVASSSIDHAAGDYHNPWLYAKKQAVHFAIGIVLTIITAHIPLQVWKRNAGAALLVGFALLVFVLIPGIGRMSGGGRRWIALGPLGFQASELAKICMLVFFASFLARKSDLIKHRWQSFIILVGCMGLVSVLLLLEPDFGSAIVMCFFLGIMMFVAGVPIVRMVMLSLIGGGLAWEVIKHSSWRMERIKVFLNPFADPYDSGYQLVNSLIAFGRGDVFGTGLGNSIQKLFFLPDAHTDFIFAIIAEEFGLVGVVIFIAVYVAFIVQMLRIARTSLKAGNLFSGYLCIGVAAIFSAQAFINMGAASGLLPTKGLTLPFISYGGSSLLICFVLLGLVVRAHLENVRAR